MPTMSELENIFKDFLKTLFQKDDFDIKIEKGCGRYVSLTSLSNNGSEISLWCENDWTGIGDNPSISPEDIVFSIAVERPASHWKKSSVKELKTYLKHSYPKLCSDDGTFNRERIKENTLFIQLGDYESENPDDVNKYTVWFCYSFKLPTDIDYTEQLTNALKSFWVNGILSLDEKEIIRNDKYLKNYIENSNDVLFNHYFVAKVSGNQHRFNEAVEKKYWLMQQRYDVQTETKSAVSNNFNYVQLVHENDILLLVNGSKIFAYGFAQKNMHQSSHQISLRDVIRKNKHEYFEDCEYLSFSDSEVYYEKMGASHKDDWSQYIDVDKWHSYRPNSNVNTSDVGSYSKISNLTIYEVDCVWAIEKIKQLDKQYNDSKTEDEKMLDKIKALCLNKKNIILQGAPGSGKTYKTAELALSLIDALPPRGSKNEKDYHKDVMDAYDKKIIKLNKDGTFINPDAQIGFVTFHQSMDYEDFIEGIKPKTNSGQISYEIEDGIFKIICKNASQIKSSKKSEKIDFSKTRIFKMSLGEKGKTDSATFDYCHEKNVIALGWGRDIDFSDCDTKEKIREKDHTWGAFAIEVFKLWMRIGDIVLISDGNRAIKAIAKITGNYEFHNDRLERMKQYRNVEWLYTGDSIPISKIYDKNLSQQSIYAFGNRIDENHIENGSIKENILNDIITGDIEKEKLQNYVLIIDEINRGNVSKIFGELISLLEADKRAGGDHPLTVTLPYSKEPFSVPSNLYVIGTMNTTDRSVGSIDYAVRRRFAFYTLKANKDALESYYNDKASALKQKAIILYGTVEKFIKDNQCSGIDFNDLMVGHSYFMAKDFDELNLKWDYEVIPLLEEYKKDGLLKQSADLDIIRNCENYSENQDTQTTLNNPSEQ